MTNIDRLIERWRNKEIENFSTFHLWARFATTPDEGEQEKIYEIIQERS